MTEPQGPSSAATPPGRSTGAAVLGGVLAVAGLVWLLAAADAIPVSFATALGLLLVLVGVAHAVLPQGSHHALLVAVGITLAFLGAAASALDVDLADGSVGERRYGPVAPSEVEDEYSLGIGSLRIDLTRLDAGDGSTGTVSLRATVGIGELVVAVPGEASVEVDAHVAVGDVAVRDTRRSGIDVRLETEDEGRDGPDAPTFRLELDGGIGSVRVVDDELGDAGGDE